MAKKTASNNYINFLLYLLFMSKSAYSILVTLLALLLVSPIAGVNHSSTENNSDLLSNNYSDLARGDYDVDIDFEDGNEGISEATRNEEVIAEFVVSNTGTFDDVYDLSVTWNDEYELGWNAYPEEAEVSVASGSQEVVSFIFQAPVQNVYDGDSMEFTVEASSQNSSTTSADIQQTIEIDMIYAVDIYLRDPPQNGNRGESIYYSIEVKNVGETSEDFVIEVGQLPWDWEATPSISSIELGPDESDFFTLEVNIPDKAAEDEYAVIETFARVQTSSYDYIYGFCESNTTVNDGLIYGVDIIPDAFEKQVIPGGQILYNLYVTNEGDETDSFALELGDVMSDGWGSGLSQYTINDLGPGEETLVTMNVTSPDDSVEDDWSLSFVEIYSINRDQFGDSVEMNTSVRIPVRDLSLTVDQAERIGDPGAVVTYTVSLENTGTDIDDFTLAIVRCDDCSAWGVSLSTYEISDLEDGEFFDIELNVEVPQSARDTDSAEMGIVASSVSDSMVTDSISTLTTVDKVLNRHVSWESGYVLNPGDSSTIGIVITNLGNSYQSYTFESDELPSGWTFDGFPHQTDDLEPYGGEESFTVNFQVADNANPGYVNFTIDVILDEDDYKLTELMISVKVEHYAEFNIEVIEIESFAGPGETHTFNVDIMNNANIEDDINLEITGLPDGWETCILVNQVCSSKISVGKGKTTSFILEITTNPNEAANTGNGVFLHLEAVSGLNSKESHFDTFTVYTNPVYDLSVEIPSDRKDGDSGETIPFQIVVTNEGNAMDYVSLTTDSAPPGWLTSFSELSFTLEPSQSKTVYLNVEVPVSVYGGENVIETIVSSESGSGQSIDFVFVVYVAEKADVDVELKTTAGDVTAGTTGKFIVRLTNNGNTVETVSLKIEGKRASWFTLPPESELLYPGDWEEIIIEVKPPIMQAATETSGMLNVTLSTDVSKTTKVSLPFSVLKSDLVIDEPIDEEEDSLLPAPSFISVILIVSLLSRLIRRR
jgi:uncharacterized membrane protein